MKLINCLLLALLSPSLHATLDLNGDGMSDVWATLYAAQLLPPGEDSDHDGYTNLEESIAGTNPLSSASKLTLPTPSSDLLSWPSVTGKSYQLQVSTDLRTWSPTGPALEGNGEMLTATVDTTGPQRFWRLSVYDRDADFDGLTSYEEALLGYSETNANSNGTSGTRDYAAALTLFGSPGSFTFQGQTVAGTAPSLAEASRFLQQATMGSSFSTITGVSGTGIPAWLNAQFAQPATSHVSINNALTVTEIDPDINEPFSESRYIWTWWNAALTAPDVLRQRVAFALSEIFVVAQTTDELGDFHWGIATYYDILVNNAFGNYRDLLYQISTNPAMGHYLSHVKNRPTDPVENIFPDENYAREVMQLFSIGLFELNQDGSRRKDSFGNDIPTYDNTDITNFAKVFTGLTYNPENPNNGTPYYNDLEFDVIDSEERYLAALSEWMGIEMAQYEPMHESGPKTLLNGTTTNGTLQQDLDTAIDNLFNHPNTGPFLGRLLIQRLVKSNPSPDYIRRVAAAFNDNGSGIRGDLQAVVRAILLDPEARNRSFLNDPTHGKLREPLLRHTHVARAFNYRPNRGAFRVLANDGEEAYGQTPMASPSVFNFYLPDHQPLGPIKDAGLVAPEFQITTATTTIKTLNFYLRALPFEFVIYPTDDNVDTVSDYSAEIALVEAEDVTGLIDRLDILLTRGQMSSNTRSALMTAIDGAMAAELEPIDIVLFAVSLIASSPDSAVLR